MGFSVNWTKAQQLEGKQNLKLIEIKITMLWCKGRKAKPRKRECEPL